MSVINQIKVLDTISHEYAVADVGAKAENIEFDNGSNLEDKFVNFAGATSETAGTSGLVPAPAIADRAKFLKADGTWADPAGGVTSVNNQTGAVVLGASDVGAIASTAKGAASGVAELDANGKVPAAQLPSSGSGSFASLSDVEIVNPTYGELIMYDSVKQKFVNQNNGSIKLLPWSSATDEQIISIINAYYDGIFTLADIQSVWSIGDVRTMNISAIATSGTYNNNTWSVGESHRAQTVKVEILDFNHDTLTTPINGKTKALVTVDLKDCLMASGIDDTNGSSNSEHGYMNSSNTNAGGWTSSARRKWCNGGFYQAIPEALRNIIKPVNKLTSAGNQSATINTDSDYIFLLSEIEIFGSINYSKSGEGSQYTWFANAQANRYKSPHWNSSYVSDVWWERSPRGSNSTGFCIVNVSGYASGDNASGASGLVPAWAF